jgi:hypothetical protein
VELAEPGLGFSYKEEMPIPDVNETSVDFSAAQIVEKDM